MVGVLTGKSVISTYLPEDKGKTRLCLISHPYRAGAEWLPLSAVRVASSPSGADTEDSAANCDVAFRLPPSVLVCLFRNGAASAVQSVYFSSVDA